MARRYAKALALFTVLVMAISLTGCGTINIVGLAIPTMVELIEGDMTALEVSYSADRDNVSDEALLDAAEKLELEWVSSDEAIVTVDENGNLTAIKGGEATVTVKAGEISSTCRVMVRVPLKGFEAESTMSLYINGSVEDIVPSKALVVGPIPANADNYEPVYTSADESIATVDEDGIVTAVSNGKTTITVTSGDISTEIEVTVYTAPAFIEVEDAELTVGKSGELTVKVDAENVTFTNPLTYKSSDEDVCKVDEDGVIAGISEGEATITVSNGTGVKGTATITVKSAPVVRPATSGTTGNGSSGGTDSSSASGGSGNTGSGSSGSSGGGSTAPEPTTPAGEINSTNWYLYYDCELCKGKGHDRFSCPNVAHYHGNGYDEGVCPGCSTIYCAYLAPVEDILPEGNAWE